MTAMDQATIQVLIQTFGVLITAILTIVGGFLAYVYGRKRNNAEIDKLKTEKSSIEAAAGLSTAEAASIISNAAAQVVKPLTERIQELQHEVAFTRSELAKVTVENTRLKTRVAELESKITLLEKEKELSGEIHY